MARLPQWRWHPNKHCILKDQQHSQGRHDHQAPQVASFLGVHGHAHSHQCNEEEGEQIDGKES